MPRIRTIEARLRHESERIKGSRFIADVGRAEDIDAAEAFVQSVRDDLSDASHHVYAWRINPETLTSDDDGEPRGTSGRPLLDRLVGGDLEQTVLVVTRYFGGTKLGKGGLVRAYGQAASEVLLRATIVEERARAMLTVGCSYELAGPLTGLASRHEAEVIDKTYTDAVRLVLSVPVEHEAALRESLRDRAAGKVRFD